ncbi:hypothetical protein TNCV_1846111 [Trichonephila clavipes]|nr:hypothetical protein TNCV_1846111 [Trichonephila clavipes]
MFVFFRGAVGDKFVFMDDNATCHRTLAVQDCLDSEGIQRLVWPARSPDLNPIENVWDALGRQVAGPNYPPTNKNTLIRALTEEWDKLPQQLLDNVGAKVWVRRVECCITLHGGHIPYRYLSLRCLLTLRCIVPFLRTQIKGTLFFLSDFSQLLYFPEQ